MDTKVLSIAGKGSGKDLLRAVPTAPKHLGAVAKKGYKEMGNLLAKAERLKTHHLGILEGYAVFYEQWIWANEAINRLNKECYGEGYIQTFKTGARNISPEVTTRDSAFDGMLKCSKQFGLDPKSEKDIKAAEDSGQLDMFQMLLNAKKAQ